METLWFVLVAAGITAYVLTDGYDLGAGIVHLFVARDDRERSLVFRSIGPYWDGNEVWLLAGGGTLVLAFPTLYARAFSGFYLPLCLVLWLLIGRACAIELRHDAAGPTWSRFWDAVFAVSSTLLALCLGAALGNVVRGVPFDGTGRFFEPLWTDWGTDGATGILDWYTLLAGLTATAALALHGALWIMLKTEGPVHERARTAAWRLALPVAGLATLLTAATISVQPHVLERLREHPWGGVFPALAVAGLVGIPLWLRRNRHARAFLASAAFLVGMLGCAGFGIYPYVLPGNEEISLGLTVQEAAAGEGSLRTALLWWVPGVLLAVGYQILVYRLFRGKVAAEDAHY